MMTVIHSQFIQLTVFYLYVHLFFIFGTTLWVKREFGENPKLYLQL